MKREMIGCIVGGAISLYGALFPSLARADLAGDLARIRDEARKQHTSFEIDWGDTVFVHGYGFRVRVGRNYTGFEEDGHFDQAIPVPGQFLYLNAEGQPTSLTSVDGPLSKGEKMFIWMAGAGHPYKSLEAEIAESPAQTGEKVTPFETRRVLVLNPVDSAGVSYDFKRRERSKLSPSIFVPVEMHRDYFLTFAKKAFGIQE